MTVGIVFTILWIIIGIVYVARKCLFEVSGSKGFAILVILLYAGGLYLVGQVAKYTESKTCTLVALGFFLTLPAFIARENLKTAAVYACGVVAGFAPLFCLIGIIDTFTTQNLWSFVITCPLLVAAYFFLHYEPANRTNHQRSTYCAPKREVPAKDSHAETLAEYRDILIKKTSVPPAYIGTWLGNDQFLAFMRDRDQDEINDASVYTIMKEIVETQQLSGEAGFEMRASLIAIHKRIFGLPSKRRGR